MNVLIKQNRPDPVRYVLMKKGRFILIKILFEQIRPIPIKCFNELAKVVFSIYFVELNKVVLNNVLLIYS